MKNTYPKLGSISLSGGFLGKIADTVRNVVLPYQWEALNDRVPDAPPSGAIHNFKAVSGEISGEHIGYVFQDSDLYKWLEGCAYAIAARPDAKLEAYCDETIGYIKKAQQPDGYVNTYYQLVEPDKRYTNLRDNHELYCAGHLIEAGVAYYQATGKRELLDICIRLADHIDSVFGPVSEGKKPGYPGHQELELALCKLYNVTGDEKYLRLATFFIDERGREPNYFEVERDGKKTGNWNPGNSYYQSHIPVREQTEATGHAVRALYMYCAMADLAIENNDESLLKACHALYDNVTKAQMYITGGVGSESHGECFTLSYDLPNDYIYAETCASIALIFFSRRMLLLDHDARYADVMERALYNTVLASMQEDGKRFFYVNPLEVDPKASEKNPGLRHVLPERPKWFGCACCPPNLSRLISDIGRYMMGELEDGLAVYLYGGCEARFTIGGSPVYFRQESEYPYSDTITFTAESEKPVTIRLRVPEWAEKFELSRGGTPVAADVKRGFIEITEAFSANDQWTLRFPMRPRRVYAHPNVRADIGKVAVQCGPLVYCLEQPDNGAGLARLALPRNSEIDCANPRLLTAKGVRLVPESERLYTYGSAVREEPAELRFIPYYTWANRGAQEMTVWVREK